MNEEINKAQIVTGFVWHVTEFEHGSRKTVMFWTGGLYDHICVLDNSFGCYMEIPNKIGNKRLL